MPSPTRRRTWSAALTSGALVAAVLAVPGTGTAAPTLAPAAPGAPLTAAQAVDQARRTHVAVPVTGSTTETETLTANPDGTFTLTQAVQPVRKRVAGAWTALDATLRANPDGSVSPAVAIGDLRLSGGGGGPLATVAGNGHSVSFSLPVTLPAPVLSGNTATYVGIARGVDLVATADTQGGFSEVLVVHDAAAATTPLVRSFALNTTTNGVSLAVDATGNLAGTDARGHVVLTAAAPRMWDSSRPAAAPGHVVTLRGRAVDADTGQPVASSAAGPGLGARSGRLAVALRGHALGLGLDPALMADRRLTYPLYVDPTVTLTWTPMNPSFGGWAVISDGSPSTKYWKDSPSGADDLQAGLAPTVGDTRRTLLNFTIDTTKLAGAAINSAELDMYENWAWNCTPQKVDVYAPAKDLTSSNADWNDWPTSGNGSLVNQQNVAYGYSSSCDPHNVGFDIRSAVLADAGSGNKTQTFLIKADSESSNAGWKRFAVTSPNVPSIVIKYNRKPDKPTGLLTSPTTSCTGSTVGDTTVKLYASVSDPDGNNVGEDFKLWKTSDGTVVTESDPHLLTAPSGSGSTPYQIDESWFVNGSGGQATNYSWQVRTWDGGLYSDWSTTCSFTWDPTRAGTPVVTPPSSATIGSPATFTVNPPTDGTMPSSYMVQLNSAPPFTVAATNGVASFSVTPNRFTNTVTVTSLSAGSNIGSDDVEVLTAQPAAVAPDGDLTGDGLADLVTVGGGAGLAPGVWLTAGNGTTGVNTTATNLGAYGNGVQGDNLPSDFTGAQVITGHFTGSGLQDLLYYYPATAGGAVLNGNGDGSPINANLSSNEHTVPGGALSDMNSDNPLQIANAGNTSGNNYAYPDLIGISGDSFGYYLDYYPDENGLLNWAFPTTLPTPVPGTTTGMDWNNWSIATAQLASGATDMFLWHRTNGDLYVWTGMSFSADAGTFTYTETLVKAAWRTTGGTLDAADVNNDGTPDVYVTSGSTATAYLVTGLTGTPSITAQANQTINTANHTWMLADGTGGTVTTAADDTSGTAVALTGSGNVAWNTGDLFDPDVAFDVAKGIGSLSTTSTVVPTTGDFTVSAWVKPDTSGGTVVSEDAANTAAFKVWAEPSDKSWRFAMPTSDVAAPTWVTAAAPAGSMQPGVWAQVAVTYRAATGAMVLWVNGVNVASNEIATAITATGGLRLGDQKSGTTHTTNYSGQLSGVQVWTSLQLTPVRAEQDVNGDGRNDAVAVDSSGKLWLYPGTGGSGSAMFGARINVSTGWSVSQITLADWNSDGLADIVIVDATGTMYVYPNLGGKGLGTFATVTGRQQIGSGWASYKWNVGNFDNNPHPDEVGIDTTTGTMYKYPQGTGKTAVNITGWGVNNRLFVVDYNHDGKGDVIDIDANGTFWLYPNTSATTLVLGTRSQIGSGWASLKVGSADLDGDGYADAIAVDANGNLLFYRNNHSTFSAGVNVGSAANTIAVG